jgi:hypothetical protein
MQIEHIIEPTALPAPDKSEKLQFAASGSIRGNPILDELRHRHVLNSDRGR